MMKLGRRILAGVICFFMIALQILTLAACGDEKECSHHFGKWFKTKLVTCDEEGLEARRCEHCGEIETATIMPTGHEWSDATCTTPKTCKICGKTDGDAKGHTFTVDTVKPEALKSAATCTEAAVYYKSCTCGAISTNAEEVFTSGSPIGHADVNKDHACDNGCNSTVGEHTDGDDKDHLCDYGCGRIADDGCYDTVIDGKCDECDAVIGHVCADSDKNHACDTCGADMGVCADENKNHVCDYGCSKTFGEHTDGDDNDHKCDYGCKQVADLGCDDFNKDGICDECGADIVHECVDEDKNHSCELCSADMGDHIDRNFDHVCEYGCSEAIGACEDTDKDHKCDYGCTETFGEHSDANDDADHVCDYGCGAILEACYDDETDGDHSCDLCGNADVSGHSWGEATCGSPATCSDCGATTGSTLEHTDADFDHICDNGCGKNDMGNHSDAKDDADHVCDYGCEAVLEECVDVDTDDDHSCDICGKAEVTQHSYATTTIAATCEDSAKNIYTCDCGHSYEETVGAPLGHNTKGFERQIDGCEYVMEHICQREKCGKVVSSETTYHHKHAASIDEPATCISEGRKIFKCTECGDTSKAPEIIPADSTGHDWHQLGEIVGGVRTDECSNCKQTKTVTVYEDVAENLTANDFKNEIEVNNANISLDQGVIDKIGDDSVTLSADKLEGDARKELGLTEEQLQEQVGDSPIYNFTINNGTENISDFGKDNFVTITLPYELKEGEDVDSIAIWFISDECADEECETENCEDPAHRLVSMLATYNNGFVTFKTNHFSYYTVTRLTPAERCELYDHLYSKYEVKGSCTADSYTLKVCIRCHHEVIENLVKAEGHKYVSTETQKGSCTTNGITTHVCSTCGNTYKTTVFASGHNWELEGSEKATCSADGYTKYGCTKCDEEYTVTYAKLPHAYTSTRVPATCTADGYTLHECDNCDYSYTNGFVEALGHDYKETEWSWAADYSSATLTFACEHDATHVVSVNADVTVDVVNGSCSVFVKTTYTATVSYNGNVYTDAKSVERGDPNHNFSDAWKKDKNEHWHECICGERTDVTAHEFENATTTKAPTCAEAGQSVATCATCGEVQKSIIPATGKHNYVNGFCTECGAEHLQNYYVNLVNSYKGIDGFSISVQDLAIDIKEYDIALLEKFELIGSVNQLDVTSLAISFKDGKISGSAIGSLTIFNGPIADQDAIYKFKAIIDNGYLYVQLEYGTEGNLETTNVKMSVDTIISSILENIGGGSESAETLSFFADTVIPAIDTLIDLNVNTVDEFLEDAFNAVFTFEQKADGSYVARIDYEKLRSLNENLASKTVAELVDLYFGEGKFDSITNWIKELLGRKLSELDEYVDELGLNSADIIEKINELCLKMGAPVDYDFSELIHSDEYKDLTLGMLIYDADDDSYIENLDEVINDLREYSVYALMGEDDVDEMKEAIGGIIDALASSSTITFTTDSTGMLSAINVGAADFTYSQNDIEVHATFKLELLVNGTIDTTWGDIVGDIESGIVLPKDEMLDNSIEADYYTTSGTLNYKGSEYKFSQGYRVTAYKPLYDSLDCVMYVKNCNAWINYQAVYSEIRSRFVYTQIMVDDVAVMVIHDEHTGETVEIINNDDGGFTAIYEDGTIKDIYIVFNGSSDTGEILAGIYFEIFGDSNGTTYYMGEYVRYYYNSESGEYASSDMHDYVYEYDFEGDSCLDGCTVHVTCNNCDYESTSKTYRCEIEYGVEVVISELCRSSAIVNRCKRCGRIDYIQHISTCSTGKVEMKDILADDGHVIGTERTSVCDNCGIKYVTAEWIEEHTSCTYTEHQSLYVYDGDECILEYVDSTLVTNHKYEYTYTFDGEDCNDGYTEYRACSACGDTQEYHYRGHTYDDRDISLEEYGLCGGYINERYCRACGKIHNSNINEYCNWIYLETTADGYDVYKCKMCSATKMSYSQRTAKDAECNYIRTQVQVYIINGEEVYRYENASQYTDHDYSYDFTLNGESCLDGYHVHVTCRDCGYNYEYENNSGYHQTFDFFRIKDNYNCCDKHHISIWGCPCGENFEVNFDSYSFEYDEESQTYSCKDCDLKVLYVVDKAESGCLALEITNIAIYIGDKEMYSASIEKTLADHDFSNVEVTEIDGKTMIVTSCTKCSTVNNSELVEIELNDYYDYTVTPTESGNYRFYISSDDFISVKIYRMVGGQMLQEGNTNGYNISYTTYLNAGDTYVYRISYYSYDYDYGYKDEGFGTIEKEENVPVVEGSVAYGNVEGFVSVDKGEDSAVVDKNDKYDKEEDKENGKEDVGVESNKNRKIVFIFAKSDDNTCSHRENVDFAALASGAESCTEGVYYGRICVQCGMIENVRRTEGHSSTVKDRISLSEHGACYGEYYLSACPCGEQHEISFYSCAYETNTNEYYDDSGKLIHVKSHICENCNLRYTCSYYTVKADDCKLNYYYTVTINIGSKLILDKHYTVAQNQHNYETVTELVGGVGSSCYDGVIITQRCKDCGHEESSRVDYHKTYEKERIELSELGCICGGYAVLTGCACDESNRMSIEHCLCDFDQKKNMVWIDGVLENSQYTIDGYNYYSSSSLIYTCAVTDPVACAYKIRYARYWLKAADECMAYQYETWQFGYNEKTGEFLYEITFNKGNGRAYHNYIDESTDNSTKYTCKDCGSYFSETYYYDDSYNCTMYEKKVLNTLDDGNDKYYELVEEYGKDENGNTYTSHKYEKRIYADETEYWYEENRSEEAYQGTFGENGRKIIVNSADSNGNSSSEERAYVYYKGYQYSIYNYKTDGDHWEKRDYTYDFTNGCVQTCVYLDSYGKKDSYSQNVCRFYSSETIKAPTCSQSGEAYDICSVCGSHSDVHTIAPHDHNWVNISYNWYYCFECGLENANGASGEIIMEDLTEQYGNGENYVVGYYAHKNIEFTHYVSLILADGTEIPIMSGIELFEIEGIRAFAFSKASVDAWAVKNGYSDYDVRFSFVPVGSDGSLDYAVTFAEKTVVTDTIVSKVSFVDYVDAGEIATYTITPAESGVWTFTAFGERDSYATLYSADGKTELISNDDGGYGNNFKFTYELKAGETYIIAVRWWDSSYAGEMPMLFGNPA